MTELEREIELLEKKVRLLRELKELQKEMAQPIQVFPLSVIQPWIWHEPWQVSVPTVWIGQPDPNIKAVTTHNAPTMDDSTWYILQSN